MGRGIFAAAFLYFWPSAGPKPVVGTVAPPAYGAGNYHTSRNYVTFAKIQEYL